MLVGALILPETVLARHIHHLTLISTLKDEDYYARSIDEETEVQRV